MQRVATVLTRALLTTAVLTVAAGPAAAERRGLATAKLAVGVADHGETDVDGTDPDTVTGVGLAVSWEAPPPAYPDKPGYATRFELVPEMQVMRLTFERGFGDETVTNAITAGLRLQLAIAQKQQGLLRVSMRGTAYLGARTGFVSDDDRTRVNGLTLGERIWLGDRYQLGFEVDGLRFAPAPEVLPGAARTPWATASTDYTAVTVAITLGGFL